MRLERNKDTHSGMEYRLQKKIAGEVDEMLNNPETNKLLLARADLVLQECEDRNIGTIIFLDKAARPLAWLLKERATFQGKRLPEVKFINVGTGEYQTTTSSVIPGVGNTVFGDTMDFVGEQGAKQALSRLRAGELITTADAGDAYNVRGLADNTKYNLALDKLTPTLTDAVLIVDDQVSTGASLLTAMKVIENTGTEAQVYGTSFFVDDSRQATIDEQRRHIPWRGLNYSGVIEDVDSTIFTKRPTEERIEQIREKIQEAIANEAQQMDDFVENVIGGNYLQAAEQFVQTQTLDEEVMRTWEKIILTCKQLGTALNFAEEGFLGLSKEEVFARLHRSVDPDAVSYKHLEKVPQNVFLLNTYLSLLASSSRTIEQLRQAREQVEEPEVYIARGKAMRAAMKRLATEEVPIN